MLGTYLVPMVYVPGTWEWTKTVAKPNTVMSGTYWVLTEYHQKAVRFNPMMYRYVSSTHMVPDMYESDTYRVPN